MTPHKSSLTHTHRSSYTHVSTQAHSLNQETIGENRAENKRQYKCLLANVSRHENGCDYSDYNDCYTFQVTTATTVTTLTATHFKQCRNVSTNCNRLRVVGMLHVVLRRQAKLFEACTVRTVETRGGHLVTGGSEIKGQVISASPPASSPSLL